MVTVREPVSPLAAKSPVWLTVTETSRGATGGGLAVKLKVAVPPSSIVDETGFMLMTGIGASSLSFTVKEAEPPDSETT